MREVDRYDKLKLVAELFLGDNPPTNAQAAATISRRLGKTVTVKNVSQMRNSLGLGWYPGSRPTKRQQDEARLVARWLAQAGVRNTFLENLHAGKVPDTQNGDYLDVSVVTPTRTIPWPEISRISDPEMRKLMLNIEKNLARQLIPLLMIARKGKMDGLLDKLRQEFKDGVTWDRPHRPQA